MRRKTSSMVEGAIFAGIAIVFNLLFFYVPFLGIFINMVLPLPTVICTMRNGLKWGIMSLVVATAIVAMVVNPVHALFYIGVFGILGVVLGECMHRHYRPKKLFFYATIGGLVSLAVNFVLALYVMGINPVEMLFSSLEAAVPQMETSLQSGGLSGSMAENVRQQMTQNLSMMKLILPVSMMLVAPALVAINYWAARKILGRMGEHFDSFPSADEWIFPMWSAGLYIVSLFAMQMLNSDVSSWKYITAANIWALSNVMLVVDGLIVIYWYIKKNNKPSWWFKVFFGMTLFVPLLTIVLTYVGGYDVLFDIRKLRSKKRR